MPVANDMMKKKLIDSMMETNAGGLIPLDDPEALAKNGIEMVIDKDGRKHIQIDRHEAARRGYEVGAPDTNPQLRLRNKLEQTPKTPEELADQFNRKYRDDNDVVEKGLEGYDVIDTNIVKDKIKKSMEQKRLRNYDPSDIRREFDKEKNENVIPPGQPDYKFKNNLPDKMKDGRPSYSTQNEESNPNEQEPDMDEDDSVAPDNPSRQVASADDKDDIQMEEEMLQARPDAPTDVKMNEDVPPPIKSGPMTDEQLDSFMKENMRKKPFQQKPHSLGTKARARQLALKMSKGSKQLKV